MAPRFPKTAGQYLWCAMTGSNRRLQTCKDCTLPTELIAHTVLYNKSYSTMVTIHWLLPHHSHLRRALRFPRLNQTRRGRDNELPRAIVFRAFSRSWLTTRIANQCHGKVMTPCNKPSRCASDVLDHFTLPRQLKAARAGFEPTSSFCLLGFGVNSRTRT